MSQEKQLWSWKTVAGATAIAAVVLILLFKPLAISYHRWELLVANKRIEQQEDVNYGHVFFHCQELDRLGYTFHADFVFDRVEQADDEAQGILYQRLSRFLTTLPDEPLHLCCMNGPPGDDDTTFRVCDLAGRMALWIEFHEQHNAPDLVERFGASEEP